MIYIWCIKENATYFRKFRNSKNESFDYETVKQ